MPGVAAPDQPARLLLTRPRAQADDWAKRMASLGVPTASLPLIDIAPAGDPASLSAAWAALPGTDLAMFVSPNAVEHFFDGRSAGASAPLAVAWPDRTWAATVGPGSARALSEHGVPAARIVQPPAASDSLDSEHLWPELVRVAGEDWTGRRALLVRGDGGREWLGDRLRDAGAEVSAVSVYRRACPTPSPDTAALLCEALAAPGRHVWLFSSSEAIGHLDTLEQGTRLGRSPADWGRVRALATHERIAARARALGVRHVVLVRPDAAAVAAGFRMLSGSTLESPT
ncbi:uroporphyrinogen-III synthase [Mitsuaria sp. GD03876]|uniref:uroporphyrinogen-III synthase n=1 Tax=Mitsuaria sp. GD03876 TaxID=2975399 RepID=UPI00244D2764|nr:uroporphyrinogen-III synthase [Mitsuaria sp. GD03876]MDH0867946.1 uroporphyrinogen-III synthase [Mitsuaria sp. GD03876]